MSRRILLATGLFALMFGSVASATLAPTGRHAQTLSITITRSGIVGPVNIAIAPGVPVKLTVTNYTATYHTFTIPGLHVSALVRPGSAHAPARTTITFTAQASGWFKWYCYMCEHGFHGDAHHMSGWVLAIIDPRLVG